MKKLNELSYEELLNVLNNNQKFASKVLDDAHENYSYFLVDDILHNAPKCASYSISGCGDFFHFKNAIANYEDIFVWLEDTQKNYCILGDDISNSNILEKLYTIGAHYEEDYHNAENYKKMEARFNELIHKIEAYILEHLSDYYTQFFDNKNLAEYLQEEINADYYNEFYIDDNNNVFEPISYTKEYIA